MRMVKKTKTKQKTLNQQTVHFALPDLKSISYPGSTGSWASGWSQEETPENPKKFKFFDWRPRYGLYFFTAEILR